MSSHTASSLPDSSIPASTHPGPERDVDTDAASVTSKTSVASMTSHMGKKTKLHSSLTEGEEQSMAEEA